MGDQEQAQGDNELARAQAKSLADLGDFDAARESLARAIDAAPADSELHAMMAWVTARCRTIDPHERDRLSHHHLAVSFEASPDNPQAHYYQGRIHSDQGNVSRARIAFEAALRARPDFRAAQDALDRLANRRTTASIRASGSSTGSMAAMPRISSSAVKVSSTMPSMAAHPDGEPESPRKLRPGLTVMLVLALLLGAGGLLGLSKEGRAHDDLQKKLGTTLPIESASMSAGQLHMRVGNTWSTLSPSERKREMFVIVGGSKALGLKEIFVYGTTGTVAEAINGKVCVETKCLTLPP